MKQIVVSLPVVLSAFLCAPSRADDIGTTSCRSVVSAFDREDTDKIREYALYIRNTMQSEDRRRQSDMTRKFSREGFNNVIATAIENCRREPSLNLRKSTLDMYDGVDAMQRELGR